MYVPLHFLIYVITRGHVQSPSYTTNMNGAPLAGIPRRVGLVYCVGP